jgi:NTE family protein
MAEKKLGIALGGGGGWSLASVGVLKVLEEEGIKVDYIAACSMGSLIGTAYSSGTKSLDEISKIMSDFRITQAFNPVPHKAFGMFSSEKIGKQFEEKVGRFNFEDLKIPLTVVATDFRTGEEVVFKEGPVTPAITGSSCFMFMFTPYEYQGRLLTDGGISNPTPVDLARKMGADVVIGIDVTAKGHLTRTEIKRPWHHPITVRIPPLHYLTNRHIGKTAMQLVDLLFTNLNRNKILQSPPDFLLVPQVTHHNQFNFKKTPEIVREGERVAREIIPDLKKALQ